MKKQTYLYSSVGERLKTEYRIYLLAFLFILIADSIGQIKIPVGKGFFIIFPIFYAIIMGILCGPDTTKILKDKHVQGASRLVIVAILPFIAKLGINAGANIMVIFSAGPALLLQELGNLGTIFLALPVALLLGLKRETIGATILLIGKPTWPWCRICLARIRPKPAAACPSTLSAVWLAPFILASWPRCSPRQDCFIRIL